MLTLATIVLLAFTNLIASIKFVFLLYPRLIVMLFLIYFFFSYMIDQDKLDIYFHTILLNDSKYSAAGATGVDLHLTGDDYSSRTNLSLFRKLIHVVYRLVVQAPVSSSSSSSSSTTESKS